MRKDKIKLKWLRLSEETNALDYLNKAYDYILLTATDIIAWKWVVLSLHTALYGFAICASKGTNPDNVTFVTTKKGKRKLLGFDDALVRCQDPDVMGMTILSRHLQLSSHQKESIEMLKKVLRNNFEHYMPMRWSIEIHGMPKIAIDVLDVIRFLALNTGNCVHLNQSQKKRVKTIVFQSKRILKKSTVYKEFITAKDIADDR